MTRIMIIRHAEKPSDGGGLPNGIDDQGRVDPEELIVQGWKRRGALARFFAPANGLPTPGISTPATVFASAVGPHSKSLRPQHTVMEVVATLGKNVQFDITHPKGKESALAAAALAAASPVLIAWEHDLIPSIVGALGMTKPLSPTAWSGARFDMVWVLDRVGDAGPWAFSQVPQLLLAGDSPTPFP